MRILIISFLLSGYLRPGYSQSINYSDLFGNDWKKAEMFVKENRHWIEPVLIKNNISFPIAVSIIFPELVRYSALQDKMEITLLKTLYVNLGLYYADFSIGVFQMKPSFAEIICENAPALNMELSGITFPDKTKNDDIKTFRKMIIRDLENPERQVDYLIAFIKLCDKSFPISSKDEMNRIKFLATAYNFGIDRSAEEIESMIGKKYFNTKMFKTENYPYADVAWYWYCEGR